ncbi:MAG: orotidine 5'-phosphate decarboxylase [Candidatus Fraserbacteria bacterium RBG_16_55_9]|uniref:Orotidine 5'-phosphate decarboxylase n=1 Tax=Fraserbacteria sp. (strain RBG_16_55_9) TaxID=1817864 RepID=A0A1F5UY97_FRAXR|nr:MAG: orotidine 5'-phosphate decarboxylase [Candidatus Fraserbacteria bacterium RBG_16_55_9]
MNFSEKLLRATEKHHSWLCIGLDPDLDPLPLVLKKRSGADAIVEFNRRIIEATQDLVCAYKPNSAFYEALGPHGLEILTRTREVIPREIPVILDAKRGDIANTARKYAQSAFEVYKFDAITVNPYMGWDSIEPFLAYKERAVFLLCRTSNPGARDFQDLNCSGVALYQVVAEKVKEWSRKGAGELALVAGATYPEELQIVREIIGEELMILVPGVGAQEGDLAKAVRSAANSERQRAIINVSRSILYASAEEDFAQAARREAQRLRDEINQCLE